MIDYVAATDRESSRIVEVAASTGLDAPVPSCPDWALADLVWHLAEVQHFWGAIVGERLSGPEAYREPERPPAGDLVKTLDAARAHLVAVLSDGDAATPCWTWHEPDRTVGFVRRRQAHEALIHRVDAELAAGDRTPLVDVLAADGVDEIVTIFLTGVPTWAGYRPDGTVIRLESTDVPRVWAIELGRMVGTSPTSGRTYDVDAGELTDETREPDTTVAGAAADLDLWLWGRGPLDRLTVAGKSELAGRVRELAADATQ